MQIYAFNEDIGSGLPIWLPNGGILIEEIERLAKELEFQGDYHRVKSPAIARENLFLKSGHLPYYADGMFPPIEIDGQKYYLKAMNCPHHHSIYNASPRSYKELPLRFAEYGQCYRYEDSGSLQGLMRCRVISMNDAHIYVRENQLHEELCRVRDLHVKCLDLFGIKCKWRLSLHSKEELGNKYINKPEKWEHSENALRKSLEGFDYYEAANEAAFYGPKVDLQINSVMGREFSLASFQVDFAAAENFNLQYRNENNEFEAPLVIHRAPLSGHERLIGFLLEHFQGNFPFWLQPMQISFIPISNDEIEYCKNIANILKESGIRCEILSDAPLKARISDSRERKVALRVVVGKRDIEKNILCVKHRDSEVQHEISQEQLINIVLNNYKNRNLNFIFQISNLVENISGNSF